jgi:diguanylate cyclase
MVEWESFLPHLKHILEHESEDGKSDEGRQEKHSYSNGIINGGREKLLTLFECLGTEEQQIAIEEYVEFCLRKDVPYLYISNRLSQIFKALLSSLTEQEKLLNVPRANKHFHEIERKVSEAYYKQYLRKLIAKNHLRLSHLSLLVEKHLMVHYQQHLEWMLVLFSKLDGSVSGEGYFELDPNLCPFGKWLHEPTFPYINNTSHFSDMKVLHVLLHDVAKEIIRLYASDGQDDYATLIHLIQSLDYRSLEIGNEIAIINDMIVIGEYSKDPMTGLLGRRQFDRIVMGQLEIAKATETDCAMIMCDLDRFKSVNDKFGHLAGDEVIKDFAALLRETLRRSDFIFRFGGEEFFVVLPSTHRSEAYVLATTICKEARRRKIVFQDEEISYTVSIGVSSIKYENMFFVTKETIDALVQETDARLYLAKSKGRNRVE